MLEPLVLADHETVSQYAADWLVHQLRRQPAQLLCLASGTTPARTYTLLAEQGAREPTLFNQCRVLKLDEWGGLAMTDPATCESHVRSNLIDPLKLGDRYVGFDSRPADPHAECARIAQWLEENGPIDICVLGLGRNGHLGFNEPAEYLKPHAHVAQLSEASLGHSMLEQSMTWPTYGLTLGMADLMESRQVLLIVTGAAKREPLERLLCGQITTQFPASMLQMHPNVLLLCDAAAIGDQK
jgi:galactosamine-6-phosphate isomerase